MPWPYRLRIIVCFLLTLVPACAPLPASAFAAPGAATAAVRTDVTGMEEEVRQGINAVRRQHGRQPLAANPALAAVARAHSRRMAQEHFFSHRDPGGRTLADRLRHAGIPYRVAAENLLTTTNMPDPVAAAIEGWMQSCGHRANILRKDVSETGVGIWRAGKTFYFTQLFLAPAQ